MSAAAAAPLAPAQSSASGIQAWTDGVRERELRGHTARVVTVSIDGDLLASVDIQSVAKLWDLRTAECVCTWQLSGRGLACVPVRVVLACQSLSKCKRSELWRAVSAHLNL